MIQKINSPLKQHDIIICIYDMLNSCKSNTALEVATNLSDYMVNRFLKYGFDVVIGNTEEELLSFTEYSHACVIATGTSFKLSDRLIQAIINKCKEDFFLAGHILDRGDYFFELHHQFYIVNLDTYRTLNYPEIGQCTEKEFSHIQPKSITNDSYISQQLHHGDWYKKYKGKMHGWNIISCGLHNYKPIIDLGEDIRNNKKYFYYEYDHVFLKEIGELNYNQFLFNNIVVPFNSDRLEDISEFKGPVEQYITTGTGLNWVCNLHKLSFTDQTEVIFTDVNPLVLQFMKKMINEWDGKNYISFYKNFIEIIPNNLPYNFSAYIKNAEQEWERFLEENPNWEVMWQDVVKLKFKFISIDYMTNYNLDWIRPGEKTFFNISDVFDHVPTVHNYSVKLRILAENKFINNLKNIDPNIYLLCTSRSAQMFMEEELITLSIVKDINLIDIETITTPYWHKEDWKTLRPLM